MSAGEGNQSRYPNIPGIGPMDKWIDLIHTIGLPWVMIILSAYYGIPYAKDIATTADKVNKRLDALDQHAKEAMPLLQEAGTLLQSIHNATRDGARQRHEDIRNLRSEINSVANPDGNPPTP